MSEIAEEIELPNMPEKPPIAKFIDEYNRLTRKKNDILEERRKIENEIIKIMRNEKKSKLKRCGKQIRIIGKERLEIRDAEE